MNATFVHKVYSEEADRADQIRFWSKVDKNGPVPAVVALRSPVPSIDSTLPANGGESFAFFPGPKGRCFYAYRAEIESE